MFTTDGRHYTKRFNMARFVEWVPEIQGYDVTTSMFESLLRQLDSENTYVVDVPNARPDWLSYKIYGDTQYWWVLLWYNDLGSFRDLVEGTEIRYPSLRDLDTLSMTLHAKESVFL